MEACTSCSRPASDLVRNGKLSPFLGCDPHAAPLEPILLHRRPDQYQRAPLGGEPLHEERHRQQQPATPPLTTYQGAVHPRSNLNRTTTRCSLS